MVFYSKYKFLEEQKEQHILRRKTMFSSNNQTKSIYTPSDVEDLSYDTAANIQSDAAMTLYKHANFQGDRLAEFNGGGVRTMSSNADNQASSVIITEGTWSFYDSLFWLFGRVKGKGITLGPGRYNFVGLNDKISSLHRAS